ncbi:glycoside hydrolase family protein [Massilia sp. CCM 8695]|uniref:Lysozyme n=1 Tax=Massilia frigida TaxID=2609281 RepID=A0ABX0NHC4_9BURK|nr:glycoside hydrolase family protein [Massilia frigida]NHZ81818.1 glycoside hydrolase family protein [Massilia frigida]
MATTNRIRMGIAGLVLSAGAFVGLLTREGYTDGVIIPTKGDAPTLGFGTTGGVKMGDRTTPVKAAQRALLDVRTYEGAVKDCVRAPLSQAEYDVYVDLAYNIGPTNFCYSVDKAGRITGPSTLTRRLAAGDYRAACDAILMYRFAAGYDCSTLVDGRPNKRCYGVWADRQRSHAQCVAAQ